MALQPVTKPPSSISADPSTAIGQVFEYVSRLYRDLVLSYRLPDMVVRFDAVEALDITISDPPTKAEVEAVVAKLNEMILAAKGQAS